MLSLLKAAVAALLGLQVVLAGMAAKAQSLPALGLAAQPSPFSNHYYRIPSTAQRSNSLKKWICGTSDFCP